MNEIIKKDIDAFVKHMINAEDMLSDFSSQIAKKDSVIEARINLLMNRVNKISITPPKSGKADEARMLLENSLSVFKNVYSDISQGIKMLRNATTFINSFEKHLIVMVYGKVKSGKSYLGNYIMGTSVSKLTGETIYDTLPPRKVQQQDGENIVEADKLAEIEGGFEVKSTEATSTIQFFYLGGLAWFDTPGIGSITIKNEKLAQEYAQNADLIVFVTNSDASGRRQEIEEIIKLKSMNKPILLVVSQSDVYEEDEDSDGNIIKSLMPKSEKDRRDVEEYLKNALKENALSEAFGQGEIITLSTKLALEAIEKDNAELYKSSNISLFYQKLKELTAPKTVEKYKLTNPKARVNKLLDEITGETCLGALLKYLNDQKQETMKQKNTIINIVPSVLDRIKQSVNRAANEIVEEFLRQDVKAKPVTESEITAKANKVITAQINDILKEEMTKFFSDVLTANENIAIKNVGELKMRQEQISYEYRRTKRVSRDPRGFFEHIGSFFGKSYYDIDEISETRYKTHDLGINDQEIIQNIIKQFATVEPKVKRYVNTLVEEYFDVHEKILTTLIQSVNDTSKSLLAEKISI